MDINDAVSLVGRLAEQQLVMSQHVDCFQREISAAPLALAEGQKNLIRGEEGGIKSLLEEQKRLAQEQTRLT